MQVLDSSFQKISLKATLIFLFLSLTQCAADTVWNVPQALFRQRLEQGDWEFLEELKTDDANLGEAFRLGPGAPYYLSHIFRSLEERQTAEQLLALQWRRGDSPWREEAGLELVSGYLEAERYQEAESLARKLLRRAREPQQENRCERHLVEALYWQKKDGEVLSALEERKRRGGTWDGELDLFRAVSSQRLGTPGWQQLFVDLFFRQSASGLHLRAYAYLEQEGRLDSFSEAVSLFFFGKYLLYRGQNAAAIESIENSLPVLQSGWPDPEILFRELGAAYLAEARYGQGAESLLDLSTDLSPERRLPALEMAGRLYRKGGEVGKAEQLLSQVVHDTGLPQQRDRAVWFLLDMAAKRSSSDLLNRIKELAPLWHEPQYFADILETEISGLAARRNWLGLLSLYDSIKGYGPPDTVARLAYLNGRTLALGLLDSDETSLSPQAFFLDARSRGHRYYRLLAETALADMGFSPQWNPGQAFDRGSGSVVAGDQDFSASAAELIRGYFEYGLLDTGIELLQTGWRFLPPDLLLESVVKLQKREEYLNSIRLMNLYVQRKQEAVVRSDLELLYPRAFAEWIDELSTGENLPPALFFALVREESYFDPAIVSRSGAVGLTQLMGETANDMARLLRIAEYDLRDPEQNLRLGARHLSRLLLRLEDIPKALMAYNAGLSRVRRWERSFAGLPFDLLTEALPFPETRNYVRKILVSAVYYGSLYYDQSLQQTVRMFYPGLSQ